MHLHMRNVHFVQVLGVGMLFGIPMVMPLLWPLGIVALASGIRMVAGAGSLKQALGAAYLFGLGFSSVSLSFLLLAYPTDWLGVSDRYLGALIVIGTWLLCAVPVPLALVPWGAAVYALRTKPFMVATFLGAGAWVFSEYLRSLVATLVLWAPGVPVGPHMAFTLSGLSISGSDGLLWAAYIGGFWSLAAVAYLLAAPLATAWRYVDAGNVRRASMFAIPVCAVILLAYVVPPALHTTLGPGIVTVNDTVKVALVHTAFPRSGPLSHEASVQKADILSKKIVRAAEELTQGDLLVLPEDSRFFEFASYLEGYERTRAMSALEEKGIVLVDSGRRAGWDGAYSVIEIGFPGTGRQPLQMHKTLLAAFGEYLPSAFAFLWQTVGSREDYQSYVQTRAYLPAREVFVPEAHILTLDSIRFGVLACSEVLSTVLYPALGEESDVLLNVSSLAAGKQSPLMFNQFLAMAKVHALTARKPYLQATNVEPNIIIVPQLSSTRISY